ncbi:MAG: hypothetical protein ACKVTZ_18590 [Bacteroidia bacterium]
MFIQLEGESMGVKVMNKTTTSFEVVELGNGTNNTILSKKRRIKNDIFG